MAEVLIDNGIPTDLFSISGQVGLLTGAAGEAPTQTVLTGSGLATFNADPSITNMNDHIKSLNNDNTADSGFHAETWSSKLTESMNRHQSLKEKVDNTTVTTVFPLEGLSDQFKLVTRLMQTRVSRGSKRDIFFVQDGGYDTHDNVDASLIINFGRINGAIQAFVNELKILNLWESTTVVQFSEFARTLNPNTGDGSDHGWYVTIYGDTTMCLSFHINFLLTTRIILTPIGEVITSCSEERSRVGRYLVTTPLSSTKAKAATMP